MEGNRTGERKHKIEGGNQIFSQNQQKTRKRA